jgi:methyl-accepting chemotaxis protein
MKHSTTWLAPTNRLVDEIGRGLGATLDVLQSIARADVTRRVEGEFHGVFADLQGHTNAVAETLGEIVDQLKTASASLKHATADILSGANDLSGRTSRQSATIMHTSDTISELAKTVEANAEQARGQRHGAGSQPCRRCRRPGDASGQ